MACGRSAKPQPLLEERYIRVSPFLGKDRIGYVSRSGRTLRRRAEGSHPAADGGGAGGFLQAPDPPRQDRHSAGGAREPAAQEARGGRGRHQRRRRAAAHGHPVREGNPGGRGHRVAMHCPECGFANAEGANYCQKCGAFLGDQTETKSGDTTEVYQVDETGELRPVDLDAMTHEGATLVIRSGGGRSGEAFNLTGERNTIVRRRDGLYIDDLGSLNGTYVNRRRIESHRLQNGDELQVGKYKLTYLEER